MRLAGDYCNNLTYNNTLTNDFNGILENLFINIIAFVIILLTFIILNGIAWHEKRLNLQLYQNGWTTLLYSDVFDFIPDSEKKRLQFKSTPIDKNLSYFQMLWYCFISITNSEIAERCGTDALEYLRYLKCTVQYNAINTGFMILCVLPANIFGSVNGHESLFVRTTMANVNFKEHPYSYWIHIATSFLLTVICFARIRSLSASLIGYRKSRWSEKSILVRYKEEKSISAETIENFIGNVLPSAIIEDIKLVYKYHRLLHLHKRLEDIQNARFVCEYIQEKENRQLYVKKRRCFTNIICSGTNQVEAVEYYEWQIQEVKGKIAKELNKIFLSNLPIAFVTFQNENFAKQFKIAKREYLSPDGKKYIIKEAPDAENIIWTGLSKSRQGLTTKTLITNTAVLLVAFFLTTPTIILSGSKMEDLSNRLTHEGLFLFRFLPTVLVWLFSLAISSLVTYSSSFLDFVTKSGMNRSIMLKTVLFLIFTVVLLPSLGLTSISAFFIWSITNDGLYKWECIFLPDNGSFFVSYVMTSAFIAATIQLLRLPQVFLCLYGYLNSKSDAEKLNIRRSYIWDFSFGVQYSHSLLIFSLVLFYSMMCPLIAPFGFFYFSFKLIIDRYNICFANQPSRTSYKVHSLAIHFMMLALVMKDVGLALVMHIKGGLSSVSYTSEALALVTIAVYVSNMNPCKIRFLPKMLLLPHQVSMTRYRDYTKEFQDRLSGIQVYQPMILKKYLHFFKKDKYDNPLPPRRTFFSEEYIKPGTSSSLSSTKTSKSSEGP